MKYILILILILSFFIIFNFSCKSPKNIESVEEVIDFDQDGVPDEKDIEIIDIEYPDRIVVGSSVGSSMDNKSEKVEASKPKPELSILPSTTDDNDIKKELPYSVGRMVYSVPDTMKVGHLYDITLRITKYENDSVLIEGIDKNNKVKSKIVLNNIRVGSVMTALLIDLDSNFIIKSTSTSEQNIEDFGYTEWNWIVKPTKVGENRLRLLIKVRVFTEDGEYLKDIPVYDQKIKVQSNIQWTLKNWSSKYWQWLMSTIIIPIFIYFWRKRGKDSNI